MNELVLEIIKGFNLGDYRPIVPRSLDLGCPLPPKAGNLVKVIKGMRRSGKSYRLLQAMDAFRASGVPWSRICYFNFEDDRLRPVTSQTGDEVLKAFEYLNPGSGAQGLYLFFDEIQEMENWGAWLRRIVDMRKATIYVSGSSSQLLSSEISTEFRGRAIDFELLPCSFREALAFNPVAGVDADAKAFISLESARLEAAFWDYLARGGFPSVQNLPAAQRIAVLQSYARRVVARDVVERHNLARPRVASAFALRTLGSNAREFSIRKVENDFRSVGMGTSRGLLGDLLSYFEEAYLLFQVKELSRTLSENSTASPKVYAVDPGLALANSKASANDEGQRLENAVYLELRRRGVSSRQGEISSLKTKAHAYEVDFVRGDALFGASELYQVCVSMSNEKTRERELRALWEALEETGLDQAILIVGRGESYTYENGNKRVLQIPAWRWFLEG